MYLRRKKKERDVSLIPGSGRSPGEGNGTPLQYFHLEDATERATCWATFHGITKSQTGLTEHSHNTKYFRETTVELVKLSVCRRISMYVTLWYLL